LKEFSVALKKFNVETKVVYDVEVIDGFPSRRIQNWFQTKTKFNKLIEEFKPDAVFIDRQRHFGIAAICANIPLLVHLRGDFWKEIKMAKQTLYKSPPKRIALWKWQKIAHDCFSGAKVILPICKYLENRVKEHYPEKPLVTLQSGIDSSKWYQEKGMELKHPCVGLLQGAVIWEKAKEMLTLTKVLESMPQVNFYWAGDGPYRDKILSILSRYKNFKWLGPLTYPDNVRKYLTEIDVYALISGIDMSPLTLQEAQLMEKPLVATNVGGIPELMINDETGFLIEKGNYIELKDKLRLLLTDEKIARRMGRAGQIYVKKKFSWEVITKKFVEQIESYVH